MRARKAVALGGQASSFSVNRDGNRVVVAGRESAQRDRTPRIPVSLAHVTPTHARETPR